MISFPTTQIPERGLHIEGDEPPDFLDLGQDRYARPAGPVHYDLNLVPAGSDLVLSGSISAPFSLLCGRCAEFFSTFLRVSASLHVYEWAKCPEILDVTPDVREDLLLEIPGYPVCSADCKGLCPRCGTNLNRASCSCSRTPDFPSPWSALDALDSKDSQ